VAIRTKEPDAPNEFPPARLFLDDIEEILRTLAAALRHPEEDPTLPPAAKATFAIRNQECDDVQELTKIAKKTTHLSISVERSTLLPEAHFFVREDSSYVAAVGFTREEQLSLYHKLAPIFERRNLWLRTLIWSHRVRSFGALIALCLVVLALPLIFILKRGFPHPTRTIVVALLLVSTISTLWVTLSYHSIIILRHSSEPSPLRQELVNKFPLLAISNILTFLLTVLGLYLKHKYWP
jgi:hypothetical protein